MSANPKTHAIGNLDLTATASHGFDAQKSKPVVSGRLPAEVKTEIENLRRLVQTVQDRLHALTRA